MKRETSTREVKNHLAGAERGPVKFEREGFEEGLETRFLRKVQEADGSAQNPYGCILVRFK